MAISIVSLLPQFLAFGATARNKAENTADVLTDMMALGRQRD